MFELATILVGVVAVFFYFKWQEERIVNRDITNFAQMLAYTNRELYRALPDELKNNFREIEGP